MQGAEERMSDAELFSMEREPAGSRYTWRLWLADLLELATAALLGWGGVRALEKPVSAGSFLVGLAVAWVLLSLAGGLTGRTFWRHVTGVRLETEGGAAPGLPRAAARALTVPVDLLISPVLQYRPLDGMLKLRADAASSGVGAWAAGLGWQLPWLAVMLAGVYFIITPTKEETVTFLGRKLTGWQCCHGSPRAPKWQCETSLVRLVREVRRGDAEAAQVAADCPVAAERLKQ